MIDKKKFKQQTLLDQIKASARIRSTSLFEIEEGKEFPLDILQMTIDIVDKLIKCFSNAELDLFLSDNPEYKMLINRYRNEL